MAQTDHVSSLQGVKARPLLDETVFGVQAVGHFFQAQHFMVLRRGVGGPVHQAQQGQRLADGLQAHVRRLRVGMLAALQRHAPAAA